MILKETTKEIVKEILKQASIALSIHLGTGLIDKYILKKDEDEKEKDVE